MQMAQGVWRSEPSLPKKHVGGVEENQVVEPGSTSGSRAWLTSWKQHPGNGLQDPRTSFSSWQSGFDSPSGCHWRTPSSEGVLFVSADTSGTYGVHRNTRSWKALSPQESRLVLNKRFQCALRGTTGGTAFGTALAPHGLRELGARQPGPIRHG